MADPLHPAVQAHLDAVARQAGYHDYATWQAFNAHRTDAIVNGSNTTGTPAPSFGGGGGAGIANHLQQLLGPLYPANMFAAIGNAYQKATGQ